MDILEVLPENTKGRDFIVGDIHGAYAFLDKALASVDFDPETDRLISVGDLIDRGPESYRCLEFLKKPWFYAVKGNHEDMFLDMCSENGDLDMVKAEFNIRNGMGWIIDLTPEERRELYAAFSQLPVAMEIPTPRGKVGLLHAEVPESMNWQEFIQNLKKRDDETMQTALWGRSRVNRGDDRGVEGIDRIFFGHTPQKNGAKRLGNCYYIDTGAVFRMLYDDERAAEFMLTMADVTADTIMLSKPPETKGEDINVITSTPDDPHKPFEKFTKPGI